MTMSQTDLHQIPTELAEPAMEAGQPVWIPDVGMEPVLTHEPDPVLNISEIFGPTFQGEGSAAGQHCLFVRLFECNLTCKWCDTAYTWAYTKERAARTHRGVLFDKAAEMHPMTDTEVLRQLKALWKIDDWPTIVVFSGGEPLIQQGKLRRLFEYLYGTCSPVHIETAGTIVPWPEVDQFVDQYSVSPKLANSGNPLSKRRKHATLKWFAVSNKAWFKFVCSEPADLVEVDELVDTFGIRPSRVMLMPEGTKPETTTALARVLAPYALERGYGLSMRQQVLIWGDKRGT